MRFTTSILAAAILLGGSRGVAQTPATPPAQDTTDSVTGRLSGTVRDSLGFPVSGATLIVFPGGQIIRTSDSGSFDTRRIRVGPVKLEVRRLGFAPVDTATTIQIDVENVMNLVMRRIPQQLAEVVVKGDRQCGRYTLEGILCRREVGRGHFISYEEILAKKPVYLGDIMKDEPGFRVFVTKTGRSFQSVTDWRCVKTLVNGDEVKPTNPAPLPKEVFAVEVYQRGEYPPEYQHWPWRGKVPCTLVVFWTKRVIPRGLR